MLSNFEMMAIALLVVNLFVTIYFNYRRQEDYDDGGMQKSSTGRQIDIPAMPMAATTAATTRPPMMNGSMLSNFEMMANRSNGPRDN